MPKLKDLTVTAWNKDNREIHHTVTLGCSVSTDGEFAIELEEDIVAAIREIANKDFPSFNARVGIKKNGTFALYVSNLSHGEQIIHRWCQNQISAEVIVELRIFYQVTLAAPFFKDTHGNVHPNAQGVEGGTWHGHAKNGWASEATHKVGLGASIVEVKEVRPTNGGKSVFSYRNPVHSDQKHVIGKWGEILQRFTVRPMPRTSRGEKETHLPSVPYTEANAKFFAESVMGLCRLADRLETFMQPEGLEDRLLTASGIALLPSSAESETS